MISPLLFGILLALAVMIVFVGVWRMSRARDPVEARLDEYGVSQELEAGARSHEARSRRVRWSGTNRLLNGFGLGPTLAGLLVRADVALTAAEFAIIIIVLAFLGFLGGTLRSGPFLGAVLALLLGYLPVFYLSARADRRQQALVAQLPDLLTLLVGALRAGLGLPQAIDMLVHQIPEPASVEFGRVVRAINLGSPLHRALDDMAARVASDDLDLVVTAINVQYEMGGNLAQTLDIIGETVRDRIHIKREIRVYTAQQRLTGYVLAALPLVLGLVLFFVRPGYMQELFQPGWILLPVAGAGMLVLGFVVIRRILKIEA